MKKIGLIGGMGWESTVIYYQTINRMMNSLRGGHHTANLHVSSVDFGEAYPMLRDSQHSELASLISRNLELQSLAGCDVSLICCNTAHQALPFIDIKLKETLIPIMDTVAQEAVVREFDCVAVLGTSSTLRSNLYDASFNAVGISCLKPNSCEAARIDQIIFSELMFGVVNQESIDFAVDVIARLKSEGAQAVVLGCTELPMLIKHEASCLPLLDSVELHCRKAVSMAMEA